MDSAGNFIMETKDDFHIVHDGYLIIYMLVQDKTIL